MAVCQYTTEQQVWGVSKKNNSLRAIVYDVKKGEIIENDDIAEQFLSASQANGLGVNSDSVGLIDATTIENIRHCIVNNCIDYKESLSQELQLQYDNERELRYKQTEENYNLRIESLTSSVEEQKSRLLYVYDTKERQQIEGGIRITEYNLNRTIEERDETLHNIKQDAEIKVSHKIVSLNLISVQ